MNRWVLNLDLKRERDSQSCGFPVLHGPEAGRGHNEVDEGEGYERVGWSGDVREAKEESV